MFFGHHEPSALVACPLKLGPPHHIHTMNAFILHVHAGTILSQPNQDAALTKRKV